MWEEGGSLDEGIKENGFRDNDIWIYIGRKV